MAGKTGGRTTMGFLEGERVSRRDGGNPDNPEAGGKQKKHTHLGRGGGGIQLDTERCDTAV